MPVSFTRRSKVLLALVASMTLGSGLLLGLAPEPIRPLSRLPLSALALVTEPVDYLATDVTALRDWHRIVIHECHDPAGSLEELDRAHRARFGGCAYHFVINADGTIEASTRWRQQALAPKEADGSLVPGIQVVLIGKFDRKPPAEQQLQALRRLVEQLSAKSGIPRHKVFLHSQLESVNCPGPAFPRPWMSDASL